MLLNNVCDGLVQSLIFDIAPSMVKSKGKSSKTSKADKDKQDKSAKNKKQKKSKADKDPNAPKKPLTAFMLYTNKRRAEVMKENPGMKITEISTIIGKEWKELTDEEKNVTITAYL